MQGHKGIGKFPGQRCQAGRTWGGTILWRILHFEDLELSVTWEPQKYVLERSDLHLAACWEAEGETGMLTFPGFGFSCDCSDPRFKECVPELTEGGPSLSMWF